MNYLGIDLGEARVGLACGDSLTLLAIPVGTIIPSSDINDIQWIMPSIDKYKVEEIVIGLPLLMDGSVGDQASRVRKFIRAFRDQMDIPVHEWDERLSTYQAQKMLRASGLRRSKVKGAEDSLAASLLLQSFLDGKVKTGFR